MPSCCRIDFSAPITNTMTIARSGANKYFKKKNIKGFIISSYKFVS